MKLSIGNLIADIAFNGESAIETVRNAVSVLIAAHPWQENC